MRNKLIFLQIFIVIALICTSVYATVETSIGLTVSNSTLNRGDTVEVILSLTNVDSSKKVTSIDGYINYNKDVIETINYDSIVKNEDNTVNIGNEILPVEDLTNVSRDNMSTSSAYVGFNASPATDNDVRLIIDFNNGLTQDTDLLTMKFKVKSTATIGDIENAISYSMFVITAGADRSEEITKNVNLTVKEAGSNNPDNNENRTDNNNVANNNQNVSSNDTVRNENRNSNTSNRNANRNTNTNVANRNVNTADNTLSGRNLPATGAKILIIPAIILVAIAYISYNKYIKMKGI